MEKRRSKIKDNVASGTSSAAGAAIGVVVGSVISQSVNASENQDLAEDVVMGEVVTPNHQQQSEAPIEEPASTQTTTQTQVSPEKPGDIGNTDGDTHEPEVQVMGYETVTNEDGSQMDVAVVGVDGQPVMVADLNQDGIADVIATDENQNGMLEENEIHDISDQQLAMQPFQDAANVNMGHDIAQAEPDYINDADVDEYMA